MKKQLFAVLSILMSLPAAADTVTYYRAHLSAAGVVPHSPGHASSTATAVADFVLTQPEGNPAGTTLSYDIQFNGIDVLPTDASNLLDDLTALHLHDVNTCVNAALCGGVADATAGTRHVLNIFGMPRQDDADVVADGAADRITGLWDAGDANNLMPAPSASIGDPVILQMLLDGEMFLMAHTNLVPSGEIGGFLMQIPEPATATLLLAVCLGCGLRRPA